ncbi:hypothetical protein PCE1_000918 [Barthelona sp. PCE]
MSEIFLEPIPDNIKNSRWLNQKDSVGPELKDTNLSVSEKLLRQRRLEGSNSSSRATGGKIDLLSARVETSKKLIEINDRVSEAVGEFEKVFSNTLIDDDEPRGLANLLDDYERLSLDREGLIGSLSTFFKHQKRNITNYKDDPIIGENVESEDMLSAKTRVDTIFNETSAQTKSIISELRNTQDQMVGFFKSIIMELNDAGDKRKLESTEQKLHAAERRLNNLSEQLSSSIKKMQQNQARNAQLKKEVTQSEAQKEKLVEEHEEYVAIMKEAQEKNLQRIHALELELSNVKQVVDDKEDAINILQRDLAQLKSNSSEESDLLKQFMKNARRTAKLSFSLLKNVCDYTEFSKVIKTLEKEVDDSFSQTVTKELMPEHIGLDGTLRISSPPPRVETPPPTPPPSKEEVELKQTVELQATMWPGAMIFIRHIDRFDTEELGDISANLVELKKQKELEIANRTPTPPPKPKRQATPPSPLHEPESTSAVAEREPRIDVHTKPKTDHKTGIFDPSKPKTVTDDGMEKVAATEVLAELQNEVKHINEQVDDRIAVVEATEAGHDALSKKEIAKFNAMISDLKNKLQKKGKLPSTVEIDEEVAMMNDIDSLEILVDNFRDNLEDVIAIINEEIDNPTVTYVQPEPRDQPGTRVLLPELPGTPSNVSSPVNEQVEPPKLTTAEIIANEVGNVELKTHADIEQEELKELEERKKQFDYARERRHSNKPETAAHDYAYTDIKPVEVTKPAEQPRTTIAPTMRSNLDIMEQPEPVAKPATAAPTQSTNTSRKPDVTPSKPFNDRTPVRRTSEHEGRYSERYHPEERSVVERQYPEKPSTPKRDSRFFDDEEKHIETTLPDRKLHTSTGVSQPFPKPKPIARKTPRSLTQHASESIPDLHAAEQRYQQQASVFERRANIHRAELVALKRIKASTEPTVFTGSDAIGRAINRMESHHERAINKWERKKFNILKERLSYYDEVLKGMIGEQGDLKIRVRNLLPGSSITSSRTQTLKRTPRTRVKRRFVPSFNHHPSSEKKNPTYHRMTEKKAVLDIQLKKPQTARPSFRTKRQRAKDLLEKTHWKLPKQNKYVSGEMDIGALYQTTPRSIRSPRFKRTRKSTSHGDLSMSSSPYTKNAPIKLPTVDMSISGVGRSDKKTERTIHHSKLDNDTLTGFAPL